MKKALSIILALCLVISLVPSAFAAVENETVYEYTVYNYAFTSAAHGYTGATTFMPGSHDITGFAATDSTAWGYVAHRTASSYGVDDESIGWSYGVSGKIPAPFTASNMEIGLMLELDVPSDGEFVPTITYKKISNGPKLELYLIEKPADGEMYYKANNSSGSGIFTIVKENPNSRIGIIDTYNATTTTVSEELGIKLNLKKGRYFLAIIPNGANDGFALSSTGKGSTYISNFKLSEYKDPVASNSKGCFEYETNFDAFKTGEMCWTSDSSIRASMGYVRQDSSTGGLLHEANLRWDATRSVDSKGAKIETPVRIMDMTKTDPWELAATDISVQLRNKTKATGNFYTSFKYTDYHSGTSGDFVALRLRVPYAGKYKLAIRSSYKAATNAVPRVYFASGEKLPRTYSCTDSTGAGIARGLATAESALGYFNFSTAEAGVYTDLADVNVPTAGDYILMFYPNTYSRVLNPVTDKGDQSANINPETGATTASVSGTQAMFFSGIRLTPIADTYEEDANEKKETVNYDGGDVAPKASGITTTANVAAIAAYVDGSEITGEVINTASAAFGKEIKLTAPKKDGYKFLYWAKAGVNAKTILSHSEEIAYIPYHGANRVIAVYENESAAPSDKAEFYNANGQLIATLAADGKAPALPSLAGFGNATGWALYGSDEIIGAGDDVELSGTMLFVAQYNDLAENAIRIEINGETQNYTYGDTVTVTATARSNGNFGSEMFNYWEKDGEAVSFDLTYSFKATADAKVKAVYKEYKPVAKELRKIILTKVSGGYVFAEFIGLEKAVEKGILFGGDTLTTATSKVTMSGKDNQLAVYDDVEGEGTGYALMADGTVVYDK